MLPRCEAAHGLPADAQSLSSDESKATTNTFAGFNFDFVKKKAFDDSAVERQDFYRSLWDEGGFRFWLGIYEDTYRDEKANYAAYRFWRDTVRPRILDERKREILAPMLPPHPWGTKRPSLEQNFFECFNESHVDVLDIEVDPIEQITATGIRTRSGDFREFDVIVLATGFDAVTGSLAQLDICNHHGESIEDHWGDGLKTSIGIALAGFPNMFFLYGPQAPTAFSNGPSTVQVQATWIDQAMQEIYNLHIERFEATKESEADWTRRVGEEWYDTLFPRAKSWYQGSNIPGKKV